MHAAERSSLYLATFLMGVAVMAFEMLASRYLNPFFGSSIYTWGGLIGVVLAAMAVGYVWGGRLADRYPSPLVLTALVAPAPIYMALMPLFVDSVSLFVINLIPDVRYGAMAASLVLFCPPVALMSAVSPFVVRLLIESTAESGRIAGQVTGLSTIGSIVGTLGTVFILVPIMGTRDITFALSLGAFVAAMLMALPAMRVATDVSVKRRAQMWLLIFTLAYAGAVTFVFFTGKARAVEIDELTQGLIEEVETPYNTVFVFRNGDYVTMKFGLYEIRYTESVTNTKDRLELPVRYTREMTLGAACAASLNRMAMIGLGGGTTSRYLHSYLPDMPIDAVEIDPDVSALARKYFDLPEDEHHIVHEQDGRVFLIRAEHAYDIIMLDAYRGWFVPFHLTTREFYELVKQKLAPGGCAIQNVDPSTLLFDATMATMKSVFANVETFQAGGNIVIIAYDGPAKSADDWRMAAEARQNQFSFRYDLPGMLASRTELSWDASAQVLTDDFAPAEILNGIERGNGPDAPGQ